MSFKPHESFVHCGFLTDYGPGPAEKLPVVEVFYAVTKELSSDYPEIRNFMNSSDRVTAENFRSADDKETYLYCHTLLRLFLSAKLKKQPEEIAFTSGKHKKPLLCDNFLHFNISHTRDSFAFAISEHACVGIDLEKMDRKINFKTISKRFFSKDENEFISQTADELAERFFLLWTRKEALFKALGTGIISNPSEVEVFRRKNIFNNKVFESVLEEPLLSDYFIYSKKISKYCISVAVPQRSQIRIIGSGSGPHSGENHILSLMRSFKGTTDITC